MWCFLETCVVLEVGFLSSFFFMIQFCSFGGEFS